MTMQLMNHTSGSSRRKYMGACPSSFGRQQWLSKITREPKNLKIFFGGAGQDLEWGWTQCTTTTANHLQMHSNFFHVNSAVENLPSTTPGISHKEDNFQYFLTTKLLTKTHLRISKCTETTT